MAVSLSQIVRERAAGRCEIEKRGRKPKQAGRSARWPESLAKK
jgi:hypothetical protein